MKDSYVLRHADDSIAVYAVLSQDVNMGHENRWVLNRIQVARGTEKGKGWGTRLLAEIIQAADAEQAELLLGVSPDDEVWPLMFKRLVKWYAGFGFKPYRKGSGPVTRAHNVMVRKPMPLPNHKFEV